MFFCYGRKITQVDFEITRSICVRFNDATPVDCSKVAVKTVGIEMQKIAFFNLFPFNFLSC